MKKIIATILAILACSAIHAQGHSHEFNIWSSVSAKKNFGEKWELMGRMEVRSKNTCHDASRIIFRLMPTYNVCDWFKVGVGTDYIANWSGPSKGQTPTSICRAMVDLTENFGWGGVQFSIRERYMYAYDFGKQAHSHIARCKATVAYPIAGSRFAPYAAGEIFFWDTFPQARAFAGTKIKLCDFLSLDLAYLCQVQMNSSSCNHVAKAALSFNF